MANQDGLVKFYYGNSESFKTLTVDEDTLYYIYDTKEIYLGNQRYALGDIGISIVGTGDTVTGISWDHESKSLQVNVANRVHPNGTYNNLTVGNAKQLLATIGVEDQDIYLYRVAGNGKDISTISTNTLVGFTCVWNQLIRDGNFPDGTDAWTYDDTKLQIGDNELFNIVGREHYEFTYHNLASSPDSHAFIYHYVITADRPCRVIIKDSMGRYWDNKNIGSEVDHRPITGYTTISDPTQDALDLEFSVFSDDTVNFSITNICVHDVARYYGLYDTGMAISRALTAHDYRYIRRLVTPLISTFYPISRNSSIYYDYTLGELSDSSVGSHITVGFNLYDSEVGYVDIPPVYSDTVSLQITGSYSELGLVDYEGSEVDITETLDEYGCFDLDGWTSHRIVVYDGDLDTCVHFRWTGARDGDYEPYISNTYELDSSLVLRGIAQFGEDYSSSVESCGDEATGDGTVTRRFKQIVFDGSADERWEYLEPLYPGGVYNVRMPDDYTVANNLLLSDSNYTGSIYDVTTNTQSSWYNIGVSSSIESLSALRAYLSEHPITVLYELKTPIIESCSPFITVQTVSDYGTERYTDYLYDQGLRPYQVPIGSKTLYSANLKDKLQRLYDMPSGSGDYLVHYDGVKSSLVPYNSILGSGLLPAVPTRNGTYSLKCVVSDEGTTVSWVSNSSVPATPYQVEIDNRSGEEYPATISVGLTTIESGIISFNDASFAVTCEIACVVAWTDDNGSTYHRLYGDNVGTNAYKFTLPTEARKSGVIISVGIKGDPIEDGEPSSTDAMQISRYVKGSRTFTAWQILVSDVNNDGVVDMTDVELVLQAFSSSIVFDWDTN